MSTHRIDLSKTDEEGKFPCPKCGALISPDDETEEVYKVVETVIGDDDCLESLVIKCNRCSTTIELEGFAALAQEENSRIEVSEALPESEPSYRTQHTISLEGQRLGHLTTECAQDEDVKAFQRLRKLSLGEPFKCMITIEDAETTGFEKAYREITKAVKKKFKSLRDGDIYIAEVKGGHKKFIGRASELND